MLHKSFSEEPGVQSQDGMEGQAQLGEASCAMLSTWPEFYRQQGAFLSREVSSSDLCCIKITVGSVKGWAGQEERDRRQPVHLGGNCSQI